MVEPCACGHGLFTTEFTEDTEKGQVKSENHSQEGSKTRRF